MIDSRGAAPLRFEILGDVRVLRDTTPVDLGPAKQRAVLAVLLLQAGRPVPTHQIVDAVWGDEPPENGANVVQKYVAGLRRVLDPDRAPRTPGELLTLTGGGYVLRTANATVDADDFQAALSRAAAETEAGRLIEASGSLRAGLALWRGDALAGLTGPVFEAARTRLADAHATAWEKWAEIELDRGQSTVLIPELARLVEEFPLREGLRAQLMIALHQSGRQAEALAAFRDAREYFLDEFGAEPGEKMQEVHRRILRGESFSPAPPVSPAPAPVPVQPSAPPPPPIPGPISPYGRQPGPPPPTSTWRTPPRARIPIGQVMVAAVLPLITCSLGAWVYFVYAAVKHRDRRQFLVAGVYAVLFVVGLVFMLIDPSPLESNDLSVAEGTGMWIFALTGFVSAFHGTVLAAHSPHQTREWLLREQAREFAARDPAAARHLGIGRPDLPRGFDDGGLIDVNHMPGAEFAQIARLTRAEAHRIVVDRIERGPFHRPEDLVERGLVSLRTMRRLRPVLIAIQPTAGVPPRLH